jgi:hypothetical protein
MPVSLHEALAQDKAELCNRERLHGALGYLRPVDYDRGDPEALRETRRLKRVAARHARREANLKIRQLTLPLCKERPIGETVSCHRGHFVTL